MSKSQLEIIVEALGEKLVKLEQRIVFLEKQASTPQQSFMTGLSRAAVEQSSDKGIPVYIAEMIPVYKAITYIKQQLASEQLRVITTSAEPQFPIGKFEQLIVQYGGEYRQRATIAQLRKMADLPLATFTGRASVADFELARLRMVNHKGVYQVKYHTRCLNTTELMLAQTKLLDLFKAVDTVTPEMLELNDRDHTRTFEAELSVIASDVINAETHRTAKNVRLDADLKLPCSPQAKESIMPSWRLPSDVFLAGSGSNGSDSGSDVSLDEALSDADTSVDLSKDVHDLDTNSVEQWWLNKGVTLDETLMPNTAALYPNPQQVILLAVGDNRVDINADTGRTYEEDAKILQLIIDGQLPDALPKGDSFGDTDFLEL